MALLEIFRSKPRWLHSNPNVRAEAVRTLGDQDQAVLASIARSDAEARLRRLAARKLTDLAILAEVARTDADATVREEARDALVVVLKADGDPATLSAALESLTDTRALVSVAKDAHVAALQRGALARIHDPKALAQVAREALDVSQRLAALERVTDTALRASVAMGSEHRDVALAAIESVSERGALKNIAARAKLKAVARRARALLSQSADEATPPSAAERHARQSQVCRTVEALTHAKDLAQVGEQLADAQAEWQQLGPCSDAALVGRYDAALRVVHAGLARFESEGRERERAAAEQGAAQSARLALCEQVEALTGEDAVARLAAVEEAWAQLAQATDPAAQELTRRFAQAACACRARVQNGAIAGAREARREELCAEAEALSAAEDLGLGRARFGAIDKEWLALSAGPADERAARFAAARARYEERLAAERLARAERAKQEAARLMSLTERLEALAAAAEPSLKEATRYLREAGAAAAESGSLPSLRERDSLLARLEVARKKLYPRVQALREDEEWKRWANLSAREELCRQIEALLAVENLDEVARRIKDIDARWKTARELPREQADALRDRFRTTRDAIAVRLEAHFARLDAERSENLKRKEALCERAEALAESNDWARTAEAVRKLQEEWQAIGPVPREQADAVWRRFRAACERFFTRFKAHRQARSTEWAENLKRKEALCQQTEALVESSDWEPALSQIRGFQDEWKNVGAVRRSQSDALWKRFRAACDAFIERYKRREEIAVAANLAASEELCQRIEALLPQGEGVLAPDGLAEQVGSLQAAWRKTARVAGTALAPLCERFERACLALITAYPGSFAGTELDPQLTLRKMEKLCGRVEALVQQCAPAAGDGSADDLARQLRSALAANAMGGQTEREARWRSACGEVEEAQSAWKRLGPTPTALSEPLAETFRAACERFFALRPGGTRETRRRAPAGPR